MAWVTCATWITAVACSKDDAEPGRPDDNGGAADGAGEAGTAASGTSGVPDDAGLGGVGANQTGGAGDGGRASDGGGSNQPGGGEAGVLAEVGDFPGPSEDDQAPILLDKSHIVDSELGIGGPYRVEQDADANIFMQFSSGPSPAPAGTFPSEVLTGFARFDPAGQRLWTLNSASTVLTGKTVRAATLTPSGGVAFGGSVSAALPGETYVGGGSDAFVAEVDGDGELLWQHQWGSAAVEANELVAANPDGSLLAVALCTGQAPGNPATSTGGAVLTRYDGDGTRTVLKQYPAAELANTTRAFLQPSGDLLWIKSLLLGTLTPTGQGSSIASLEPTYAYDMVLAPDGKSFYATKMTSIEQLNLAGELTWSRKAAMRSAVIDSVEGVTWSGHASSCNTIRPLGDSLYATGIYENTYQNGSVPRQPTTTLFVARFSRSGRQQWFQQFLLDQAPIANAAPKTPRLAWVLAPDTDGNPNVLLYGDGPVMNAQSAYAATSALYLIKLSKLDGSVL